MENKIILKNERIYKCEDIKLASKENLNARFLFLFCIYSILIALVGGLFLGLAIAKENDITFLGAGIICLVMAFISWCFYFFALIRIKKSNFKDTEYNYTFYEDEVVISINSINFNQNKVLKYNDIIKCIKCKNYTFLFFNNAQAYFFLNSDLNEEVYSILKKNIKKYKE